MALLAFLLVHRTHINGFRSKALRRLLADAQGTDIHSIRPGSMTYRLDSSASTG